MVALALAYGLAAFISQGPALAGALMVAFGAIIHASLNLYPPRSIAEDGVRDDIRSARWAFAGWMSITSGALLAASSMIDVDNTAKTTVSTGGTENLLSGLWGALISSAVAFVVIIVTVVAQRRAISRQINAQRVATDSQIHAQTLEQAKNRRVQAASDAMAALFDLNDAADSEVLAISKAHQRVLQGLLRWKIDADAASPLINELLDWADTLRIGATTYNQQWKGAQAVDKDGASLDQLVRGRVADAVGFAIGEIGRHFEGQDVASQTAHLRSQRWQLEPSIFGAFKASEKA